MNPNAGLSLLPLGVGDAFSNRNYTVCLALRAEGCWLLLDCPHPIRKMMREAGLSAGVEIDVNRVIGIALSHLHADHCCGIEDFAYFNHFALGRSTRLIADPIVGATLFEKTLGGGMGANASSYFEFSPIEEGAAVTVGPFRIEARRTRHSIPTTAFRIVAGGKKLGFGADGEFDQTLIDWFEDCDLIIHEATTHEPPGPHTRYDELLRLPPTLRSRIRLIHLPDGFDTAKSEIRVLEQGRLVEIVE